MNKLASIYFLQRYGLPTIDPQIITSTDEGKIRKQVDAFYYDRKNGWVSRYGGLPDERAPMERVEGIQTWAQVFNKEGLIAKIMEFQKAIRGKYLVFCHVGYESLRGGTMLVEGGRVVVEARKGNMRELSDMFKGKISPEQAVVFKPGMMSREVFGKEVLSPEDLSDMRGIERTLPWKELGALIDPVAIEFSRLQNGDLYVHDLAIIS